MKHSWTRIRLEDVDFEEDLFTCSYPAVSETVEESIRRVGVLRPPIVVHREDRLQVASGFRRTIAAKRAGLREISCQVLQPPLPSDSVLFLENLEDNLSSRPLHYLEKALAVKRMEQDLPGLHVGKKEEYLELLGIKKEDADRFLRLAEMDEKVKAFLVERDLPERIARLFSGLSPEDAEAVIGSAGRLRLTASQVRELMEFGGEISAREAVSLQEVLHSLSSSMEGIRKDDPRGREAFMDRLRAMRLPEYTRTFDELSSCFSKINGLGGLKVAPPPFLEGDALSASLTFRTAAELEDRARALLEFAHSQAMARALDLLAR